MSVNNKNSKAEKPARVVLSPNSYNKIKMNRPKPHLVKLEVTDEHGKPTPKDEDAYLSFGRENVWDEIKKQATVIGVLKQDVETLKQDVDTLQQENGTLKQDVETLKQDVDTLQKENAKKTRLIADHATTIGTLQQEIETLNGEVETLNGEVETLQVNIVVQRQPAVVQRRHARHQRRNHTLGRALQRFFRPVRPAGQAPRQN